MKGAIFQNHSVMFIMWFVVAVTFQYRYYISVCLQGDIQWIPLSVNQNKLTFSDDYRKFLFGLAASESKGDDQETSGIQWAPFTYNYSGCQLLVDFFDLTEYASFQMLVQFLVFREGAVILFGFIGDFTAVPDKQQLCNKLV